MSIIFGAIIIFVSVWVIYEIWRAPLYDNQHNQIRPGKTLKDLFKKNKWQK